MTETLLLPQYAQSLHEPVNLKIIIEAAVTGLRDAWQAIIKAAQSAWQVLSKSLASFWNVIKPKRSRMSKQTRAFLRVVRKREKHYKVPARPRRYTHRRKYPVEVIF